MSTTPVLPFSKAKQSTRAANSVADLVNKLRAMRSGGGGSMSPDDLANAFDTLQRYSDGLGNELSQIRDFITSLSFTGAGGITISGAGGAVVITGNAGDVVTANASANLTLTTTFTDVAGATVTLTADGTWLVIITADMAAQAADGSAQGQLMVNGSAQPGIIELHSTAGALFSSACRSWVVTGLSGQIAKLRGNINSGSSGGSLIIKDNTNITALFVKP